MSSQISSIRNYDPAIDVQLIQEISAVIDDPSSDAAAIQGIFFKTDKVADRMEFLVKNYTANLGDTKYFELGELQKKAILVFKNFSRRSQDEKKSSASVSALNSAFKKIKFGK